MVAKQLMLFLGRGSYDKSRNGEALAWANGAPIEYVDLFDTDEGTARRATVSLDLVGRIPTTIGQTFLAALRVRSDGVTGKLKLQLVEALPAPAAAATT